MTEVTTEQTQAPELTEQERDALFTHHVRHLRAMQSEIDNIAKVAAQEIARVRNNYDRKLDEYKPFLIDHAKRGIAKAAYTNEETGERKEARHYKTISAGGGVYFATKKGGVQIECDVYDMFAFLERHGYDYVGCIERTETYRVTNVADLKDVLLAAFEQGEGDIVKEAAFLLAHINETPDEPDGYVKIGTSSGWTANKAKQALTRAIDGTYKLENEDAEQQA